MDASNNLSLNSNLFASENNVNKTINGKYDHKFKIMYERFKKAPKRDYCKNKKN